MSNLETKAQQDLTIIVNTINSHENKQGIISMFMKGPPDDEGFMWCGNEGGPPDHHWTPEESEGLKFIGDFVLNCGWDSSGYGFMMRQVQHKIKEEQLCRSPPIFKENYVEEKPMCVKRNLTYGGSSIFRDPDFEEYEEYEKYEEYEEYEEYKEYEEDKEDEDNEGKYPGDPRAGKSSIFYRPPNERVGYTQNIYKKHSVERSNETTEEDDGKIFAQDYQTTKIAQQMDEPNKKALEVMATEGSEKAATYMMDMAGGDYSRMRSMYG